MTASPSAPGLLPGLVELRPADGTTMLTRVVDSTAAEIEISAPDGHPRVHLEVQLGAAIAYWHPDAASARTLPADWMPEHTTSLVRSAPIGILYDAGGAASFGWAATEAVAELVVVAGVSEERKTFVVDVRPAHPVAGPFVLRLDAGGGPLPDAVARLAGWMSGRISEPVPAVPPLAERPVYSTWYTFTQDVNADVVESEAALALDLGCGSVFIDDGWQRLAHGRGYGGCGDWIADPEKFPDLAGTIGRIRERGAGVALWVAPLLLGAGSAAATEWGRFASREVAQVDCAILDPRFAEVRAHLADICVRLVTDYGADGLKIDFLDTAMAYQGSDTGGDIADVGTAMAEMLTGFRRELAAAGRPEVAFEFRQPYVSPAVARFGQILRAADCPADAVVNRRSTIDCRLLSVGQIVHSDPMMWGPTGSAEAVAQQLYGGWFSVPQISMRLSELGDDQRDALSGLLGLWQQTSEVALHGALSVTGAERGFDQVRAVRPDLGRAVIGSYASGVIDLDPEIEETTILNATASSQLVVRSGRAIPDLQVRDAAGRAVGATRSSAAGLVEIAVPAFGSVSLS